MNYFNDLTEEEIIETAMKAVPDYISRIRVSGNFDLEVCVSKELDCIANLYRKLQPSNGLNLFKKLDNQNLDAVLAHFTPILIERTKPIRHRFLQELKIKQINSTTAKAVIGARFAELGMSAYVEGQKYRAKVIVSIPCGHVVRFYVKYKDLNNKNSTAFEDAVDALRQLDVLLPRLGYGAAIM